MQEDVDMEEIYHDPDEESSGLNVPERRRMVLGNGGGGGDKSIPFLLSRQISAGLFDAKFAGNGGADFCPHRGQCATDYCARGGECAADYCTRSERLEGSTTDGSRTASTGSLVDEVGEDVYTLLGMFDSSIGWCKDASLFLKYF
jgi:hypothetical protein